MFVTESLVLDVCSGKERRGYEFLNFRNFIWILGSFRIYPRILYEITEFYERLSMITLPKFYMKLWKAMYDFRKIYMKFLNFLERRQRRRKGFVWLHFLKYSELYANFWILCCLLERRVSKFPFVCWSRRGDNYSWSFLHQFNMNEELLILC